MQDRNIVAPQNRNRFVAQFCGDSAALLVVPVLRNTVWDSALTLQDADADPDFQECDRVQPTIRMLIFVKFWSAGCVWTFCPGVPLSNTAPMRLLMRGLAKDVMAQHLGIHTIQLLQQPLALGRGMDVAC